jgi:hypothetical protein
MLRSGVGLAAVMKLLGHTSSDMTMRYIDVALSDLQREYLLARSQPRHLVPQPKTPLAVPGSGLDGVIDSLLTTQHVLEMFRRALPKEASRSCCTGSLIASPRLSRRHVNSPNPENGQRLAGEVGHTEVEQMRHSGRYTLFFRRLDRLAHHRRPNGSKAHDHNRRGLTGTTSAVGASTRRGGLFPDAQ